jgi:hypothetical protein
MAGRKAAVTLTAIECPACEDAQRDLQAALRARDQAIRGRDAAVAHLESAEVELRAKRSIITKLKGEIEELQAAASPADVNDVAEAVFAYWRARLHPNAKSFKGKRRAHVLERLNDRPKPYSCLDLLNAVDGAVVSAWTGPNGVRHDDSGVHLPGPVDHGQLHRGGAGA